MVVKKGNVQVVNAKDRIILGVDPGTNVMGYGLLRITGNKPSLMLMGILDLKKYTDPYTKLNKIFLRTLELVDEYHPDEFAIESQFFGKNVQSMLKLGRAQGVAISAALYRGLTVNEYAPLKIKMSITGNGMASKEQVAEMLRKYLHIPQELMLPQMDATDGLACALCHFFQSKTLGTGKKFTSWKDFVAKNDSRVNGLSATKERSLKKKQSADDPKNED
ncbi:MAG TPA: crossover junction endodeoxyribonuclease RuvC [Paludibacteraceae bacterium]|nr:crossover junction endodeoxyribonuclease RuvC [Paludibacteraceae bacterium]HQF51025.1 crossover junction endodeoxyribonuclease RuvC [Paludibacteraceae bacterium]HQJ90193.1 crossover junction endodeoxyribonuclease RuvC [Paludibacteraceae bacterium]